MSKIYKVVVISELELYESHDRQDAMEFLKEYQNIDKESKSEIRIYNEQKPNGYITIKQAI